MQIRDAVKEKTALAVYWVSDGKYDGVLVWIIDVFSAADDGNYRKQTFYKNHGFAKVVLILACDASNEADQTMSWATKLKEDATTSNKNTKKTQQHLERRELGETKKMWHA